MLGSSVESSASGSYLSRSGNALKRRLIAGGLVLLSLLLITVYFREPAEGGLHGLQGAGASALRPVEVALDRVSSPFRDAYGYFADLVDAKSENERLRAEVARLREQVSQNTNALQENEHFRQMLRYLDSPTFPRDYNWTAASVIARSPRQFEQRIKIAAGSQDGVRLNDPVVTGDGVLVGHVSRLGPKVAQVMLLTDGTSAVSALVPRTGASGLVEPGHSAGESLVFTRVAKEEHVREGDVVITAGWPQGEFGSIYPKNIRIGTVTSVGLTDTDVHQRIQVAPFVDLSKVRAVLVLRSKKTPRAAR